MTSQSYEAAIFDLDGTMYRGDRLLPGAREAVASLRDAGLRVLFLTNKPIHRRQYYSETLTAFGIPTDPADVISSGWVTGRYLREHHPRKKAYVIGESSLLEELEAAGIDTTTDTPGELLVVSMDRTFTYEKLDLALQTLENGGAFIATNPDRTCPTEAGEIPDAAGMIGAVEGVTGREPDAVLGKPSTTMIETVVSVLGVDPEDCLMVGDRPETDVKMGNKAGMTTVLVLTGVTDQDALDDLECTPDHVIEGVAQLESVIDAPTAVTDE